MLTGAAVQQLEDRRVAAMISGDPVELGALLSDGLLWTHASGKVDTKDDMVGQYSAGTMICFRIDRASVNVRIFDTVAIVTGAVEMDARVGEVRKMVNNRYMAVWQDRPGGAQLIGWQSARAS